MSQNVLGDGAFETIPVVFGLLSRREWKEGGKKHRRTDSYSAQDVEEREAFWESIEGLRELLVQQDVGLGLVGKQQNELGHV